MRLMLFCKAANLGFIPVLLVVLSVAGCGSFPYEPERVSKMQEGDADLGCADLAIKISRNEVAALKLRERYRNAFQRGLGAILPMPQEFLGHHPLWQEAKSHDERAKYLRTLSEGKNCDTAN